MFENPTSAENHLGLGKAFQYRGNFQQACDEYKQAIRFSPNKKNLIAEKLLESLPGIKNNSVLQQEKVDR